MIRTLTLRHVDARRIVTLGEVIGAVVLVAVALPTRLVNLEAFAGKFDEGIRGEQLLLMAAGFRPFRDIFASQGPLSLDVFYPTFVLFGQTLGAARLAPALLSIAGLLLAAWTARTLAGPVAAAVTALVLLLSPTYLKNSRLALVEVPALVPAIGAVGAAFAFQRGGDRRWLIASGLLLALALLIKPMVLPAVIPIGLAILLRGDDGVSASLRARLSRALGNGLIVAGTALALAAVVIVAVGPAEVYDQMVRFRMASRQVEGWSLRENWTAISGELVDEGFALHVAALAGGVYLLVTRPRTGLPLAGWAVASFGLLMVYSPIQFKHAVIMLPPLALLVGVAAGECWQAIRRKADDRGLPASRGVIPSGARDLGPGQVRPGPRSLAPLGMTREWSGMTEKVLPAALGLFGLFYIVTLPAVLNLDRRVISGLSETPPERYDDEVGLIGALTGPRDFILVDEPSVAFATRRLVPPRLVDTSMVRIRSRSLGANEVIAATEQYDVKLLFLFSDGLRSLRRFEDWVDERYVAVKINERRNGKDRAVYLRRDADLETARIYLERDLDRSVGQTFGGQLRLLGFALERGEVRPGGSLSLTLGWQAIGPVAADYHIITILRDAGGQVVEQTQRSLGGGGEGTSAWEPGRWVFRAAALPIRGTVAPGEYRLSVGLYDSRARRTLPLDGAGGEDLPLATVRVRG